jgi:phosphatidylserine/phosphatidylglycerophosphate/cardiolipin synthase-like enzyme
MKYLVGWLYLFSMTGCAHRVIPPLMKHRLSPDLPYCDDIPPVVGSQLDALVTSLAVPSDHTGVLLLERGATALIARAWLIQNAVDRIDAQYFIFAADNAGIVATDQLLLAAERGTQVRLLVDDTLAEGDPELLAALSAHPNAQVRIYNPVINVGRSVLGKVGAVVGDFRGVNLRMHNKLFIADGRVAITGGRNVGEAYFDLHQEHNYRDRDVLLVEGAVASAVVSFDEFWQHPLAQPLEGLLKKPSRYSPESIWPVLHQYACNPKNFLPSIRARIEAVPESLRTRVEMGLYDEVSHTDYISDEPGKNNSETLEGGGITTAALIGLVREAKESIVIQTPYLVTTDVGLAVFAGAEARGVEVRILTNSLASTDNILAFAGYKKGADALLAAGVELFELKPHLVGQREIMNGPIVQRYRSDMALHAKSMVVDGRIAVVGSFNLDPRSANLNTESITVMYSDAVARHLLGRMEDEMKPENAWQRTESFRPEKEASVWKRLMAVVASIAPILLL